MKRAQKTGRSARRGNSPAPYTKSHKVPFHYRGDQRTMRGDLLRKANDKPSNKYP